MIDTSMAFFLLIMFIPLISGFVVVFIESANPRKILLISLGCTIICTIAMLLLGDKAFETGLSFMREPITFSVSTTPLLLFFVNAIALVLLILTSSERDVSRLHATVLNFALTFGFVALMSGQFMIRYIALDVVGFFVAASVLSTFSDSRHFKDFFLIFQVLRLGDLSLLVSILLINRQAGTLDITRMINVGAQMSPGPRAWVFAGFMLAILIKLAIWPFGIWLGRARRSTSREAFWVSGFLMPTLGYYLLYRIAPIIHASGLFQYITLFIGLSFAILLVFVSHLGLVGEYRFYHMGSIYSCLVLEVVALPGVEWLGYYFVGLILYRLFLALQAEFRNTLYDRFVLLFPFLINVALLLRNTGNLPFWMVIGWVGAALVVGFWDWQRFSKPRIIHGKQQPKTEQALDGPFFGDRLINTASWLNQIVENKFFSDGILKFSGSFVRFTQWLHQKIEIELFSDGIVKLSRFFVSVADWIQGKVEHGFENSWTWIGQKMMNISEVAWFTLENEAPEKTDQIVDGTIQSIRDYDQQVLKKTLRWDLALIPLFLILILVFLIIL